MSFHSTKYKPSPHYLKADKRQELWGKIFPCKEWWGWLCRTKFFFSWWYWRLYPSKAHHNMCRILHFWNIMDFVFIFLFRISTHSSPNYRVFFIESQKVICYKIPKISLFHVSFWLKTEVTMGHLISDHFEMYFEVLNAHINLQMLHI